MWNAKPFFWNWCSQFSTKHSSYLFALEDHSAGMAISITVSQLPSPGLEHAVLCSVYPWPRTQPESIAKPERVTDGSPERHVAAGSKGPGSVGRTVQVTRNPTGGRRAKTTKTDNEWRTEKELFLSWAQNVLLWEDLWQVFPSSFHFCLFWLVSPSLFTAYPGSSRVHCGFNTD